MGLRPASDKLKRLIYHIAGKENTEAVKLALGWREIIGPLLSERAVIRKLENNVLFVAVSNNVWMQELILRKHEIKSQIRSRLRIDLKDIIFYLDNKQ